MMISPVRHVVKTDRNLWILSSVFMQKDRVFVDILSLVRKKHKQYGAFLCIYIRYLDDSISDIILVGPKPLDIHV